MFSFASKQRLCFIRANGFLNERRVPETFQTGLAIHLMRLERIRISVKVTRILLNRNLSTLTTRTYHSNWNPVSFIFHRTFNHKSRLFPAYFIIIHYGTLHVCCRIFPPRAYLFAHTPQQSPARGDEMRRCFFLFSRVSARLVVLVWVSG